MQLTCLNMLPCTEDESHVSSDLYSKVNQPSFDPAKEDPFDDPSRFFSDPSLIGGIDISL